jgi:acetyl-CoA synthetase (ADP-forming)
MKTTLGFNETRDILKKYELPMPDAVAAKTPDEATEIANRIGLPVIIKSHPQEASWVTALNSTEGVRQKFQEISKDATDNGEVIVQKHMPQGMEAIIGMTRDPELGPILTFGLSGVFTLLRDVSSRVAPVSKEAAIEMIKETEAYGIIKGDGEKQKGDVEAIADVIEKVSTMSTENGHIREIDINPLFVYEEGASVIDARIGVE